MMAPMNRILLLLTGLTLSCSPKDAILLGPSPADTDTPSTQTDSSTTPDSGRPQDTNDTDDTDDTDDTRVPKVLTVMIDGWKPEVIATAQTPTIDTLLSTAAYSLQTRVEDTTISGSGQTTFLTGVHRDKHQVPDNSFSKPNTSDYPHHFTRIKSARPDLMTASYHTWSPVHASIVSDADIDAFAEYEDDGDAQMVSQLIDDLSVAELDVISLMLSDLDVVGHTYGFDASGSAYIAEMESIDGQIARVLAAVEARKTHESERWLVVLSTDHAGTSYAHGENISEHRLVPLLVHGDGVAAGPIWPAPDAVDIVPTVLAHLGIEPEPTWGLDGRILGQEQTAPPDAALETNLIFNGDAEHERGYGDFTPDAAVPGWTDSGDATVMLYGSADGFPTSSDPGPEERGANFFCGGGTSDDTTLQQRIDLSALATDIAAGTTYDFSAHVGGYSSQDDRSQVMIAFVDSSGAALHTATIGPLTASERSNTTGLWPVSTTGTVPAAAVGVEVTINAIQSSGYNDGYADNLSLILRQE